MSMLAARVQLTLQQRSLFRGARTVLVACSGGPDSQVLLHVLAGLRARHGCTLVAAGVDHGLRPEAASELALAEELAQQLEVPFMRLQVRVATGPSLQAQARSARYQALLACAQEHGAERVAVGHTLDDQAETVLGRLLRGAGLEGLRGVVPRRADGVVRPLLDARRAEVHAHAAEHQLRFARDPSNQDRKFMRVRVRNRLLPELEAENPRLTEHLAALADDVREVSQLLAGEVQRAKRALELGMNGADVEGAREETGYVRRSALKLLVEEKTGSAIQRTHLVALERMLRDGGQVRLPGDIVASIGTGGQLCFSRVEKRGRGMRRPNH
ncbi:MAG: tRNA lysidine(34) synthetase TilS [Myxococcales bacterium]